MGNHVTPDGFLAVDECQRTIRYRDQEIIVQDTCTPEPRLDLILRPGQPPYEGVELDVERVTRLREALDAFLQNASGVRSWRYDDVCYNLDAAWEGRPGTGVQGVLFRYTGQDHDGIPVMQPIDNIGGFDPGSYRILLPDLLGLQPCPMHGIYAAPCGMCILDGIEITLRDGQ